MNHPHSDIANKSFNYVSIDESFHRFAATECCRYDAETLLQELEETILSRHEQALSSQPSEHPRTIWTLENEDLVFNYQVLADRVEIGDLRSTRTGAIYEPKHDLLAEFTR